MPYGTPLQLYFYNWFDTETQIQNYERFLVLTASRVAENRQIRKSTKEILKSEFKSKNNIQASKSL